MESFKERVQAYTLKSLRESRIYSSWTDPNTEYEAAIHAFIDTILNNSLASEFLDDFLEFQRRISHLGLLNSLSQSLIKLTAPGVPDTYQGTEVFDFSLVDPDNRRPVDFDHRRALMGKACQRPQRAGEFFNSDQADCIKLIVHRTALKLRNQYSGLFTLGQYIPIQSGGNKAQHIFAFARSYLGRMSVVVVPRLISRLVSSAGGWPCGSDVWSDTFIILPDSAGDKPFRNVFTDVPMRRFDSRDPSKVPVGELFTDWPVALLISE
jgi:(1->4)-alpha-D-glucan 1-alpha-D-glucosylmutase